jgi:hypothetical protein
MDSKDGPCVPGSFTAGRWADRKSFTGLPQNFGAVLRGANASLNALRSPAIRAAHRLDNLIDVSFVAVQCLTSGFAIAALLKHFGNPITSPLTKPELPRRKGKRRSCTFKLGYLPVLMSNCIYGLLCDGVRGLARVLFPAGE